MDSGIHAEDELHDMGIDPWELENIAPNPENSQVISKMRHLINE